MNLIEAMAAQIGDKKALAYGSPIEKIVNDKLIEIKQKGYNVVLVDNEQPTWILDPQLNPIIEFTRNEFINAVKFLEPVVLHKYLYDPFYGVLPHEATEAKVAVELALGRYESVLAAYPWYSFTRGDKNIFAKYPPMTKDKLKTYTGGDNRLIDAYGGIAHEIIISKDKSNYYSWVDHITGLITN